MLTLAHYLIGWPAALILAGVAAAVMVRAVRTRDGGAWITLLMFACAASAALTALGWLPLLPGIIAAAVTGAAAAAMLKPWEKGAGNAALGHAREGIGWAREDARGLWGWLRQRGGGFLVTRHGGETEGGDPEAVVAEAVTARGIPPVLADPVLGPPPAPEAIAAAAPVAGPWAALADYIASFEPADDMELRMFNESNAAGALAVSEAHRAFADTCLNGIGLNPAYVAGILEASDSAVEHAGLLAQISRRFSVIYSTLQEWINVHGPLPKNAREWLTGL
jgi:hypothetical protein